MIRRSSAAIAALVATLDRAQIQRVHHIAYKQRQMPLRQPLLQICRQQQLLLWIVAQVDSAHTSHYNSSSSLFSQKSLGLFRQAPMATRAAKGPLMPRGVEHRRGQPICSTTGAGERTFDAERRGAPDVCE